MRALLLTRPQPRIDELVGQRRGLEQEIAEYTRLGARLRALKENCERQPEVAGGGGKMLVNIGSDMFMQAHAPAERVFVTIGYGLMPELTLDEAICFIPQRVARLERCGRDPLPVLPRLSAHPQPPRRVELLSQRIAETNVHARAARATLAELHVLQTLGS